MKVLAARAIVKASPTAREEGSWGCVHHPLPLGPCPDLGSAAQDPGVGSPDRAGTSGRKESS